VWQGYVGDTLNSKSHFFFPHFLSYFSARSVTSLYMLSFCSSFHILCFSRLFPKHCIISSLILFHLLDRKNVCRRRKHFNFKRRNVHILYIYISNFLLKYLGRILFWIIKFSRISISVSYQVSRVHWQLVTLRNGEWWLLNFGCIIVSLYNKTTLLSVYWFISCYII
jgi:hypothetical protein